MAEFSKKEVKAFKKWVISEVLPTIRKTGSYGTIKSELSPMMARFALNAKKNSVLGYWSMLNKMTELFALPLEQAGLTLPENVIPDISTGRGFCDYLRKQGINPDHVVKKYTHTYLDGRQVHGVNQYPDIYYSMFTDWLKNIWIKEKCTKYLLAKMSNVGIAIVPHLLKAFPNQIDAIPKKYFVKE